MDEGWAENGNRQVWGDYRVPEAVAAEVGSPVVLTCEGPESTVEGVTFDNVVINGRRVVTGDERIKANRWVEHVVVR